MIKDANRSGRRGISRESLGRVVLSKSVPCRASSVTTLGEQVAQVALIRSTKLPAVSSCFQRRLLGWNSGAVVLLYYAPDGGVGCSCLQRTVGAQQRSDRLNGSTEVPVKGRESVEIDSSDDFHPIKAVRALEASQGA